MKGDIIMKNTKIIPIPSTPGAKVKFRHEIMNGVPVLKGIEISTKDNAEKISIPSTPGAEVDFCYEMVNGVMNIVAIEVTEPQQERKESYSMSFSEMMERRNFPQEY